MIQKIKAQLNTFPTWQRNLYVLWFGVFMMGIGFSEVLPFMSLYVDTLGHFTAKELSLYSSLTFSISYLTTAIFSPFWGKLADAKGRKLMLLRASFGMAIVFALMGAVTNVWQLILLRGIQGVLGGFVSNANAMIATQTPKERSGYAMGVFVTGTTSGQLLGPFLGGTLASFFSYRVSFFITAIIFGLVFLLTLVFVKEEFVPVERAEAPSFRTVVKSLPNAHLTFGLFTTTMIIQMANFSISPFIALFVRQLNTTSISTTFLAGVVTAMPGIATLLAAQKFGVLGDRFGTDKMIILGFIIGFTALLPMAFVTTIWQLIILRFIMGISNSTMMPAVQTLLTKTTPTDITSRIFSYNQSFQSMGSVLGPLLGSVVATNFGYRGVFIASAILVAINAMWFISNTKSLRE
ncbi:DHA1 family multidrug resistance protein-like MFS transporter [Weissella uvarum]|uniref:MFS transporter n=1 Tax=Weissella uvarum TaxID=1479233 RepID=UPI001960A09C|nr:MFS transporter [Weissella uvarum]MBM7618077.1 DHA1 family multidrug resistance protein-like MFS transporter [Weissella uvarum]MCM0595935.1 MFS transporter [Weissella uvarum]